MKLKATVGDEVAIINTKTNRLQFAKDGDYVQLIGGNDHDKCIILIDGYEYTVYRENLPGKGNVYIED